MATDESLLNRHSPEGEFEVVRFPPAPSRDVIPLREVLYLDHLKTDISEEDLVAFRCPPVTEERFLEMLDKEGRIIDEHAFRKAVFRGGVSADIRANVWLFLFGFYPCHSTTKEREAILKQCRARTEAMNRRWKKLLKREFPTFDLSLPDNFVVENRPLYESFVNESDRIGDHSDFLFNHNDVDGVEAQIYAERIPFSIECLIESLRYISKDVPRTDRGHAYYSGDDNPHLLTLRDALVTFCMLHTNIGYAQGMNDILARFFIVFDDECLAFWCFNNYVEKMQRDFLSEGMVHKIEVLQKLLQKIDQDLYFYLVDLGMREVIFCHRWLLLCFQREFPFDEGLRVLEIVSSHYLELNNSQAKWAIETNRRRLSEQGMKFECTGANGDYSFDLFMCVAVLTLYRDRIFRCTDGSQIFQSLSKFNCDLNLDQILCQAERLFYSFCQHSVLDSFLLL